MTTIAVAVNVAAVQTRFKRELLRKGFSLPDINQFALQYSELKTVGESLTIDFEKFLFCSVDVPTLIQLTIGSNTVSFPLDSTGLLLPTKGRVVVSPEESNLQLPLQVSYIAF